MTTKQQILYFINPKPRAWGDCQKATAKYYLELRSIGSSASIKGFHDESHVWVEAGNWVIDVVLHNKLPQTSEVIFSKSLHRQLMRQYLHEYQTKLMLKFEPERFVRRWM